MRADVSRELADDAAIPSLWLRKGLEPVLRLCQRNAVRGPSAE
jgi:hypothetical protein